MKNFLQFVIPIAIIGVVGCILLFISRPHDDTKKLYIKCENISKNYEVYSTLKFVFAENSEKCKLDIEISNVADDYIKIKTTYLWRLNDNGEIDRVEPKTNNFVNINKEETLYSYDEKTKYIFEYK